MNNQNEDKIEVSAAILPRHSDDDASWIFKSRKYIYPYDLLDAAKKIYPNKEEFKPLSLTEWDKQFHPDDTEELRDILITINSILPIFTEENINDYLKHNSTKPLGLALAIENRLLDKVIAYGNTNQLFLFLEEFDINQEEIKLLENKDIIDKISDRIVDKNKVMYSQIVSNYLRILAKNPNIEVTSDFIKKYIEHAHFYGDAPNKLLQYLLFTQKKHPRFSEISSLFWDPYTKSRKYSSWLESIRRMDDISMYYKKINDEKIENFHENLLYLNLYLEFKEDYKICFKFPG